jgi:hypothetical protein
MKKNAKEDNADKSELTEVEQNMKKSLSLTQRKLKTEITKPLLRSKIFRSSL